jgi:di/tricarboxylate transporter
MSHDPFFNPPWVTFYLRQFGLTKDLDMICFFAYREISSMRSCLWLVKNILIAILSLFFLVFGIETLVGAFYLKNPLEFIMYFFSSSLMVLISLVGIIYPAFQVNALFRPRKIDNDPE